MSLDISYSGGVFSAPQAKSVGTVTAGTGPYNLAVASYDSVSFSVATQDAFPQDVTFKSDGTKMYIVGNANDTIFQYGLSTAWDVSTASYESKSFSTTTQESGPADIFFKPDGSKFYVCGFSGSVYQYSMSTAWDVSTASYDSVSFSTSTQESSPRGVVFKSDGTKMFVTGVNSDAINEYSLSTAWDISTASYSQNFSISSQETIPQGLFFNPDGDRVWVIGNNETVYQYSLTTGWDVSTASYDSVSFSVSSQMAGAVGVEFKSDGSKMYVLDLNGDNVYQYSTGTATTLDLSTGNYFSYTPTANTTFAFSNAPASGTAAGFALALTGANVGETYDLANASYDSVSFSVATQDDNPRAVAFSSDGSKMFMLGTTGDSVYQYSLSTAWSPSSATYDSVSFSVGTQETSSGSIIFKSDGTSFYVIGYTNSVFQYDLTAAYDLSTASYASKSLSTGLTNAVGLSISTDGTKLWASDIGGTIQQFTMSTAWDVSTASSDSKSLDVSARGATTTAIYVSPDGSAVYITNLGTDTIYEYDLSTAYDISTGTYNSVSFSVATQETNPWGFTFKDDGSKMYLIGNIGDTVYQYTTGSTATATFTYPSSVKFPSGTAPAGPAIGETDVLVFYTDDGGTTYYGFQAGDAMS